MKKFLTLVILAFFICGGLTFAKGNQWCCSWHGWLSYCASNGRWVCNDWTYSPSCTCGWGYSNSYSNYYTNTYTYKKTCYESYGFWAKENYDWTCSCMAWYTRWKDFLWNTACITLDQACKDQYGSHAKSTWNWYCWCNYWYIMKNWKCVDETSEKLAECNLISNSQFDFVTNTCSCKKWYIFDWNNCISETQSCQKQYGINATAWKPWYCVCKDGYEWNSTQTSCIRSSTYSYWYTDYNDTTYTCDSYWPNAYLTYDNKCACKNWYERNNVMNYCVAARNTSLYWWKDFRWAKDWWDYINMLLDYEDELDSIDLNNAQKAKQHLKEDDIKELESIADRVNKKWWKSKRDTLDLCKKFKDDEDEYTRNIWIYLEYLIK